MVPPQNLRTWTRQLNGQTYTISTDPSQIQLDALNEAFASDMLYWAKPLPADTLQLCVEQSLCFGLYHHDRPVEQQHNGSDPGSQKTMIGFARLITDHSTFAYLTDVYVLPEHQRRGLARWLTGCIDEILRTWPALRRFLLLTGGGGAGAATIKFYGETLGTRPAGEAGKGKKTGLVFLERVGPGATAAAGGTDGEDPAGKGDGEGKGDGAEVR